MSERALLEDPERRTLEAPIPAPRAAAARAQADRIRALEADGCIVRRGATGVTVFKKSL
jgi:hypothetical protein